MLSYSSSSLSTPAGWKQVQGVVALQGHVQGFGQRFMRCQACSLCQIAGLPAPAQHWVTARQRISEATPSHGQQAEEEVQVIGLALVQHRACQGTDPHLYATSSYSQQWLFHTIPQNAHG